MAYRACSRRAKTRLKEKQGDAKEKKERQERKEVGMDRRSGIPLHPFFLM